ncbi:MAG: hypothetical protein HQM00_03965 [Magnetococcales bacterium]|nr:hypothetical protein [Magnetococcales bacterium]
MPTDKKKSLFAVLPPLGKGVDKLLRIEKKLMSVFRREKLEEWGVGLNLGSVPDVSRRAETARQISRRAVKRRRRLLSNHG